MSDHYCEFDHKAWQAAGLKDYGDFSECVEYVNQEEDGPDQDRGEWYYCDDDTLTIYYGSFGNYNSPGASSYTYADVYEQDERADYERVKAEWESYPEYLPTDDDEEDDYDCDYDDDDSEHGPSQVAPDADAGR